ncbi:MAG TPA: hypothetical protein VKC15_12530 [Gemmatimonadales bacterium]|nr:hypothetical protein [Gemmatimonadales bacterium]
MATNKNDFPAGAAARAPDAPVHWRPPQRMQGVLAPTTVIANADDNFGVVNILGSGRIRVVALVTVSPATLRVRFRLADHLTAQATNQPADIALVAGTENVLDIVNNPGYAYMEVHIISGGAGCAVSYVDVFQTAEGN